MFAVMPAPPVFSFGQHPDASSLYRPVVPSPLSSSPIRASPTSPRNPEPPLQIMSSPLGPREPNTRPFKPRDTHSSPISSSQDKLLLDDKKNTVSKFKYAARDARPNPLVRKREDKQEGRRRLFLQHVRQRADDKAWERRGGENELLKLEWSRLTRELRHAKDSDLEGFVREEEIEDEPQWFQEAAAASQDQDLDSMMLDAIEQEEEAELDALLSALPHTTTSSSQLRPESPHLYSDDDDYDAIFMDLISSQPEQISQSMNLSQDVEMS